MHSFYKGAPQNVLKVHHERIALNTAVKDPGPYNPPDYDVPWNIQVFLAGNPASLVAAF